MQNQLKRFRERIKRKPVTLIVGIICKDGIVIAGDSQTTWDTGKSWLANKMTEVYCPYGRALVAESGASITSAAMVESLTNLAKDRSLFDKHGMRGLAGMAAREVREKFRTQQFNCSSEEFQEFMRRENLNSGLMIAHYEDGPKIDTITLALGMANRAKLFFEAVGSGSDLAEYLLTDLCYPDMESSMASVVAVHIVEIAKQHDPYCGGPTKLGILRQPEPTVIHPPGWQWTPGDMLGMGYTPPVILSQSETDEIVKMVSAVEIATRQKRSEFIRTALKDRSERFMKEIMQSMFPTDDKPHERET